MEKKPGLDVNDSYFPNPVKYKLTRGFLVLETYLPQAVDVF